MGAQGTPLQQRSPSMVNGQTTEILSNLPLQILLFLNLYVMLPIWFITTIVTTIQSPPPHTPAAILVPIFTLLELGRLYLGYAGNLLEKVPELSGFGLATAFPQLPIAVFMGATGGKADTAVNLVYILCFLAPEMVAAVVAARGMVRAQSARFFLKADRIAG